MTNHATAHRRAYGYSEILSTFALLQFGLRYISVVPAWDEGPARFHEAARALKDATLWADPSVVEMPAPGDV